MIRRRLATLQETTPSVRTPTTSAAIREEGAWYSLRNADRLCSQFNVGIGDLDSYDILDAADVNFPPENYLNILADPTVMAVSTSATLPPPIG